MKRFWILPAMPLLDWSRMTLLAPTVTLLIALLVASASGCGSGSTSMRTWGDVTYQGTPIETGEIIFIPVTSGSGPSTGATITSGRYEIAQAVGPRAGVVYRVEITAFGPETTYSPNASGQGMTAAVRTQILPDQYNRATVLSETISAEQDKNRFDFHLK